MVQESSSQEIVALHVAVAATFTAEPVEKTLAYWFDQLGKPYVIRFSPYNQVFQQLLDPNSLFAQNKNAAGQQALNIIYLRVEDWLSGAAVENISSPNKSAGEMTLLEQTMLQNAGDLVNAIKVASLRGNAQYLLVFCPVSEASAADAALSGVIAQTEGYIVDNLRAANYVDTLTQAQVLNWYPLAGYDDLHTARAGHVPYSDTCYAALASASVRRYTALQRAPYKVIVLDCDNTLWKGVCGEDGPLGVKVTDTFKALQAFMQAQQEAGMLLCLASKNIEADVDAVFEQNPDMLLKKTDIVSSRVNWQPKSENIKSLAEELNLGLDSFIFIDDNPVECAEVRANCPQVATFQLPELQEQMLQFLDHIWIFDKVTVTEEDKKRAALYQQNARREQEKNASASLKDFLTNLRLSVQISTPAKSHFPRMAQLTQRTNQFNATTIRRTEAELQRLLDGGKLKAAIVQVSDKYGDYGLVGVLLYNLSTEALQVDSLILSCRALGRGVEHAMARSLAEEARSHNLKRVDVAYSHSERNEPVYTFLERVAPHSKSEFSQGTVYQYNTADLLKLVPLEAATPSPVVNGSAPLKHAAPESRQNGLLNTWQYIAGVLNNPDKIKQQVSEKTAPRPALQTSYIEPQTRDEKTVAQIWQEVLGIRDIGMEDGFKELGGTSLQLVQIYGRLRAQFEVELPFTKLFGLPTIRSFINHLNASPDKESKGINIQQRAARQKAAMQHRKNLQAKNVRPEILRAEILRPETLQAETLQAEILQAESLEPQSLEPKN